MIKTEYLNDGALIKHYSDTGMMLLQNETGIKYSEPIDVVPCVYTYTETDEPVEQEEDVINISENEPKEDSEDEAYLEEE